MGNPIPFPHRVPGAHLELDIDMRRRTVQVGGELDDPDAGLLHQAVQAVARDRGGPITIDVSALSFIGSAGLNAIVAARLDHEVLGEISVIGANRHVTRVFQAGGLAELVR